MTRTIKLVVLTLLIGISSLQKGVSQTTDEQLAVHYFQSRDFEKAAMYYERLFEKTQTKFFYDYYLKCLLEQEDYKTAEKVIKKQIKKNDRELNYYIDLGTIYKIKGEENKTKQQYEKALKMLSPNQNQINNLAQAFLEKNEVDYALSTYQRGKKLLRGLYSFNLEMATLYGVKGENERMINEFLDLVDQNDNYLHSVQNALEKSIGFEEKNEKNKILKNLLLKKVQKNPQKTVFAELLIWYFIQMKNFNGALIQARAIDKRQKGEGLRVYELAKLCIANKEYGVAIKAFEYVVSLDKLYPYYRSAKMEVLEAHTKKVVEQGVYTNDELVSLEKKYAQTLDELGKSALTVRLMRKYAHLLAFYLHDNNKAITILDEVLETPGLSKNVIAESKLELADVLVLNGEIWDASLYYSQVDKAFKHDPLGHEAKFRNARISYYTGDFEWARAQLDVLKGSTSKLIANDAMDLSMLITDNLGLDLDTNAVPLQMYARAELNLYQNKIDEAILIFDSISEEFAAHSLSDEILFSRYNIFKKRKEYEKAASCLEKILTYHNWDILGDDALFNLAQLNENELDNKEKAKELYQQLILDYTGSLFVIEARKRFRNLRGDEPNMKEIRKVE